MLEAIFKVKFIENLEEFIQKLIRFQLILLKESTQKLEEFIQICGRVWSSFSFEQFAQN